MYRTNEPYEALMEDCARCSPKPPRLPALRLQWKDRSCDPYAKPERLSVGTPSAMAGMTCCHAHIRRARPAADLRRSPAAGVQVADDDTWSASQRVRSSASSRARAGSRGLSTVSAAEAPGRNRTVIRGWRGAQLYAAASSSQRLRRIDRRA